MSRIAVIEPKRNEHDVLLDRTAPEPTPPCLGEFPVEVGLLKNENVSQLQHKISPGRLHDRPELWVMQPR